MKAISNLVLLSMALSMSCRQEPRDPPGTPLAVTRSESLTTLTVDERDVYVEALRGLTLVTASMEDLPWEQPWRHCHAMQQESGPLVMLEHLQTDPMLDGWPPGASPELIAEFQRLQGQHVDLDLTWLEDVMAVRVFDGSSLASFANGPDGILSSRLLLESGFDRLLRVSRVAFDSSRREALVYWECVAANEPSFGGMQYFVRGADWRLVAHGFFWRS